MSKPITRAELGLFLAFVVSLLVMFTPHNNTFSDNSSTPSKPFTFSPGGTILSSQVNSDFDTLYVGLANVGTANILASGVGTTQLAALSVTSAKLAASVSTALAQTGEVFDYIGATPPTGYVLAAGGTLGDVGSGATYPTADGAALYALLWLSMADAQAPVSTGRGLSGPADFTAGKKITLPDLRGRVVAGMDTMGAGAANRLTTAGGGVDGTTNGAAGATQTVTLTIAQLATHTHVVTDTHTHNVGISLAAAFAAGGQNGYTNTLNTQTSTTNSGAITAQNSGSSAGHASTQPTMVLYKIIKL